MHVRRVVSELRSFWLCLLLISAIFAMVLLNSDYQLSAQTTQYPPAPRLIEIVGGGLFIMQTLKY
jgi:peptidoglycan/LPS O-acetylase OafA/YrhL